MLAPYNRPIGPTIVIGYQPTGPLLVVAHFDSALLRCFSVNFRQNFLSSKLTSIILERFIPPGDGFLKLIQIYGTL